MNFETKIFVQNKIKSKKGYDQKENSIIIHVKDLVLMRDKTQKNKLSSLWIGPFEVIEILENENIIIKRGRKNVTVHKNNVKKFHEN